MDFDPNRSFERLYPHMPGSREALQQAVAQVHDVYQRIAPRDTGAMVASAHPVVFRTKEGWEVEYRVPVENEKGTKYAKFVEFGTRNGDGSPRINAQHNLRNAVIEAGREHQ